jgi:hypothetical protein
MSNVVTESKLTAWLAEHRRLVNALFVALALLQTVGFVVAGSGNSGGGGP